MTWKQSMHWKALFTISEKWNVTDDLSCRQGYDIPYIISWDRKQVNEYTPGLPKTEDNYWKRKTMKEINSFKPIMGLNSGLRSVIVLLSNFSLKAGYNSLRQYIHVLSNTTAISPTDIWKLSDPNIKPQYGDQVSFGLYKNFKSNTIETSVEVYYKSIKDYLDYKSGAQLVLNHHIETDVISTKGKAYGVELMVKKQNGKLNGWVSYT